MIGADIIEKELGVHFTEHQKKYFANKMTDKYVPPSSNHQISTLLIKFNKPAIYYRLCQLLCRFIKSWDFAKITYFLLKNKNCKDVDIYERLFRSAGHITSVRDASKVYVAEYLANILNECCSDTQGKKMSPKNYLDIGCGTAILTRDLGRALGVADSQIFGADIEQEFEKKWAESRPKEINFVAIKNNKLKFKNKFDLITCMMVLHHIPTEFLQTYIGDIYNLLNVGGIFMLKEHDCFNAVDFMMADIEHSLYISQEALADGSHHSFQLPDDAIKNIQSQHINYKDRFTWKALLQRAGLKCIYESAYDIGVSNTYMPSRACIFVFKK